LVSHLTPLQILLVDMSLQQVMGPMPAPEAAALLIALKKRKSDKKKKRKTAKEQRRRDQDKIKVVPH